MKIALAILAGGAGWTAVFCLSRVADSMDDPSHWFQALEGSPPLQLTANPGPLPCSGHFTSILEKALDRLDAGDASLEPHIVHRTEDFITIHDGFPKAAVHLLVLPRSRIASISELTSDHLPMMRNLAMYVAWVMEKLKKNSAGPGWVHGIHAVPSLRQLHVHLLTLDMMSPAMKNAKHFNSFQPPFLVSLDEVLSTLQDKGSFSERRLQEVHEEMKTGPLRCHRCGKAFGRSFSSLKRHLGCCADEPRPPWPPPRLWRSFSWSPRGCKRSRENGSSGGAEPGEVIDLT